MPIDGKTREDAWRLVTEYTDSPGLRSHMLGVEAAMRGYAKKFGEDAETWGIVGLLHDFDYEKQMAVMNRDLYPKLDTVMLVPSPEHAHLSSSLVREIAGLGAPIEKFVPAPVVPLLRARFGKKTNK